MHGYGIYLGLSAVPIFLLQGLLCIYCTDTWTLWVYEPTGRGGGHVPVAWLIVSPT